MHNIFSELFGFERRITSWATSQITPDPTGLSTPGSVEEYSPHSPRIQPLAITEDVLNRSAWCPPPLVIQQLRPFFCLLHREKHRPLPREKERTDSSGTYTSRSSYDTQVSTGTLEVFVSCLKYLCEDANHAMGCELTRRAERSEWVVVGVSVNARGRAVHQTSLKTFSRRIVNRERAKPVCVLLLKAGAQP